MHRSRADFVDLNFEPILALFGAAARLACAGRICSGRQGGGGHNYSSRAAPLHAARRSNAPISQQSLPPPCVPSIASSTPARAAHASHAPMHPIPITPRKPCSPRCPPHVHFLALRSAPRSISQTPAGGCAARGAPLAADNDLGLHRGLLLTTQLMVQSFEGGLFALRFVFQFAGGLCVVGRDEPRGVRASGTDRLFCVFCLGEWFFRVMPC